MNTFKIITIKPTNGNSTTSNTKAKQRSSINFK